MKSLFLVLFSLSVSLIHSEAQPVPVSLRQDFRSYFPLAHAPNWTVVGNMFKAEFNLGGEKRFAFFNNRNELVADTRYVDHSKLPHRLQLQLIKEFPSHNILELIEVNTENDRDYYATLERNGVKFTLKSFQNKWKLFLEK